MYTLGKTNLVEMQIRSRRSSFLLGRILFDELFDEPASTSSENALLRPWVKKNGMGGQAHLHQANQHTLMA